MKSKKKNNHAWLGVAVVVALAGLLWVWRSANQPAPEPATADNSAQEPIPDALLQNLFVNTGETLPPEIFSDPTARAAYQVAKDIPEVLEQLPCYCGCMKEYGHKNNLFCFMDGHGSACSICEGIALDAKKMHDEGLPIDQIKENIRLKYAQYEP